MTKPENKNWIFWLTLLGIFCLLTYVLRSVLLPFVVGIIIGYLLDPLATRFEKLRISRTTATCLVLFLVAIILIPALIALAGMIDEQLALFINAVPKYMSSLSQKIEPLIANLQDSFPALSREKIREYLQGNISNGLKLLGSVLRKLITSGYALFNIVSLLLITPVVAFYMLRDWNDFIKKVDSLLPKSYKKEIRNQAKAIDKIISSFIRGQLSVCVLLGSFYAIGLTFVGLDLGMLVGFIAGIISFIPYVGSIVGFITAMAIAFAQFDYWVPITQVIGVFAVGQFLEGNFLTPKLVGDSIGLHPVWVMFALLAGGVLLGFLGLMIAVPLAAVIGVLVRFAISKYKQSSLYKE
ncbi:MAG: AI-2E family transporter [Alphaproteobacteria bacterium]|nr:AI-2E family transporter [Alphaproteobacteria bacterium]